MSSNDDTQVTDQGFEDNRDDRVPGDSDDEARTVQRNLSDDVDDFHFNRTCEYCERFHNITVQADFWAYVKYTCQHDGREFHDLYLCEKCWNDIDENIGQSMLQNLFPTRSANRGIYFQNFKRLKK